MTNHTEDLQRARDWGRYEGEQYAKGICPHSGLSMKECKASICDCFDDGRAVIDQLRDEVMHYKLKNIELRDSISALAEKWKRERATYPRDDPRGPVAYAAVKLCEEELLDLLKEKP